MKFMIMKHIIALAGLAFASLSASAQSYNLNYLLGGTANIAATSTNTTMSATNNTTAYFTKTPIYGALQPTFKLTGSGTSACVFTFDSSVDGNTWAAGTFTISVTAAGTTTVANVSNQTLGGIGYVRLAGITNPNASAITNLYVWYSAKTQ